ncbi:MAG: hypothetical protein IJB70_11900 [Clostridia bacterium]|nr:hypothetical protein [Clostridia bacterium]
MCNLVGYAGNRPAAPILIEMLRKQEGFDGGMSTGIATVHEGRIYMRKVVGNIDTLLRETDALELPGTIGIMHSRPGGDMVTHAHPFMTENDETAVILNGTLPADDNMDNRNMWAQKLEEEGFVFPSEFEGGDRCTNPKLKNGNFVHDTEFVAHLMTHFHKFENMSYEDALAKAIEEAYFDMVVLMLSKNEPDTIFANRLSRPMYVMLSGEESFLSTCEFGFPKIDGATKMSLPLFHTCKIERGRFTVTKSKAQNIRVGEITPKSYAEGYDRMVKYFDEHKDDLPYFDTFEFLITREWKDLFTSTNKCGQYARLAYELLYQLDSEGRLGYEDRVTEKGRRITYMYLK